MEATGASPRPRDERVSIPDSIKQEFNEGKTLLLDKPLHWTSFDVVRKVRGALQIKKVGHAGTLDPLATGLLIVCTGKHTKHIASLMVKEKTYTGSITLGAVTPTYDLESTPEQFRDISHLTEKEIIDTAESFLGEQLQKPPVYSAIKKGGTAAYTLARRGEDVELTPRPIVIHHFHIIRVEFPVIDFEITCSTGTYIRSIAHDFGERLKCGGYLSALRRTAVGDYGVKDALGVEAFIHQLRERATQAVKTDN
ncbi:MAG: tRNA pseudouridine(55) synthase TruB [Ferruginibacter sp.]|nr:tRNA pseudouridine(55) synthase TruB [Ferruginibacter sp.]